MSKIAEGLNVDGLATAKGGAWYTSTVKYILENGFYAGLAQWDSVEVAGSHAGIISLETYEKAHKRLQVLKPGKQRESTITQRLTNLEI